MRKSRNDVQATRTAIPKVRFERQALTSYAGAFLFQILFRVLDVKRRLAACFRHTKTAGSRAYSLDTITLVLVLHLLLGHRRLRHIEYYEDDPMICRALGVKRLPDVSTVTRSMRALDAESVEKVRAYSRRLVLDGLARERLSRVTIDFDGSVISTNSRRTEGTAIGFNRKKKGARSYYPLFATVAQTGQVLDVLHRPGNVHDSKGAVDLALEVFAALEERLPRAVLEARLDSAHFGDEMVGWLDLLGIDFTISVPFERFPDLKAMIARRKNWLRIDDTWSYFSVAWKPKTWPRRFRFLVFRQRRAVPVQGPLQLDIFEPRDFEFEYKVVLAHRPGDARTILEFHNGRGGQEGILGELKSETQLDYIPTRSLLANQHYILCSILAHNLNRELQIRTQEPVRRTTPTRAALWVFRKAGTIVRLLIQRAGRITTPNGEFTVTMAANPLAQGEITEIAERLFEAA